MLARFTILLSLVCLFGSPAAAVEPSQAVTVFRYGEEGYRVYRIPAIVRAANGDLLAFCEARTGGDASTIDMVMKRSTDGGATWQPLKLVLDHRQFERLFEGGEVPEISVGNPAPVVDLLDPQHPGRIWLPFTVENTWVFVTHSDDHGETWAPPRDITADVKKPEWGWYATGPVHSIQLQQGEHRGRLVVPANHRLGDAGADRGPEGSQAVYSDDHGATWKLGAVDATYDDDLKANETTVVELVDGRLYFNTRDQNGAAPGTRGEAYSGDGGESYEPAKQSPYQWFSPVLGPIDPPVVQCSLLRVGSAADGDRRNLILFSGPDENGPSGPGRSDLRLRYSLDETKSWQDGPLIHEGPAAYSDMVRLEGETVGILFEAGDPPAKSSNTIRFARLDVSQLN